MSNYRHILLTSAFNIENLWKLILPSPPSPLPPCPSALGLNIAERKPRLCYGHTLEWKKTHRGIYPQTYFFGVNTDLVLTSVSIFSSEL